MEVLTSFQGILLIVGYFAVMMLLVWFIKQKEATKESYLVADRNIPWYVAAFSIAATWVWAPSMFTAAEKAYVQGFDGVFWFVVPNVLTLILFGFFADWMRRKKPQGWTFSAYIREKYSKRTHNMYLIESLGLQICSFGVQLLAGATILHKLTGLDFFGITVAMAVIPLLYTFKSGIRASILTDYWQMIWICIVLLLGLPIIFHNAGTETFLNGLGGHTGEFSHLFDENGIKVMLGFGIPTAIGLLSGTFGDQMFWQRIFSVKEGQVRKAMFSAAAIFAVVPISLSIFGFFVAGSGMEVMDKQLTNVTAVLQWTPNWFLWVFLVMILSGLISTVDSILCAVSSVAAHDIVGRLEEKTDYNHKVYTDEIWNTLFGSPVKVARTSMVIVTALAIGVANIPGMTITYLFLFYGTLRSSVMLPSVWAIRGIKMSESGLFWGLVASLLIGLPIFAYGNLNGNIDLTVTGSLLTIGLSGILSLIGSKKR